MNRMPPLATERRPPWFPELILPGHWPPLALGRHITAQKTGDSGSLDADRRGQSLCFGLGWVDFDVGYFAKRRRMMPARPTTPEPSSSRLEGSGVMPGPTSGAVSSMELKPPMTSTKFGCVMSCD